MISLKLTFNNNFYKIYWNELKYLFRILSRPVFRKIKFKGKGYYIFKNTRNVIAPQFGYAHRVYIYSFFLNVKFLSKTSVFLFGLSNTDLVTTSFNIKQARPINIFTGRGVRFSKEIVYKKQGKVSSYR
jgi:ribosomal protein L6P/L9E